MPIHVCSSSQIFRVELRKKTLSSFPHTSWKTPTQGKARNEPQDTLFILPRIAAINAMFRTAKRGRNFLTAKRGKKRAFTSAREKVQRVIHTEPQRVDWAHKRQTHIRGKGGRGIKKKAGRGGGQSFISERGGNEERKKYYIPGTGTETVSRKLLPPIPIGVEKRKSRKSKLPLLLRGGRGAAEEGKFHQSSSSKENFSLGAHLVCLRFQ